MAESMITEPMNPTAAHTEPGQAPPSWRMWVLPACQLLLIAALVLVYVAYRQHHPEVFRAGYRYLDATLGAAGAALLIASSAAMALAVWAARQQRRRLTLVLLGLTLLGGAGFLGLKAAEYETRWRRGLFWSVPYHRAARMDLRRQQMAAAAAPVAPVKAFVPDADRGKALFAGTCASCHGADAMGLPKMGVPLVANKFVAGHADDDSLLAFLKAGRGPTDKDNTTGVAMPPRGGNPTLDDNKLRDIIAYLRQLEKQPLPATAATAGDAAPDATTADSAVSPGSAAGKPEPLLVHRHIVPPLPEGPAGLAPRYQERTFRRLVVLRQDQLDRFFSVYFLLTGVHGLCVLVGLGVVGWLLVQVLRGRVSRDDCGPLCQGRAYWLTASAIWLVLFPLVYLAR